MVISELSVRSGGIDLPLIKRLKIYNVGNRLQDKPDNIEWYHNEDNAERF